MVALARARAAVGVLHDLVDVGMRVPRVGELVLDGVDLDLVGIEGQPAADLLHRRVGLFVGPHRVLGEAAVHQDRVVRSVALVWAMGLVVRPREVLHRDVRAGEVDHRRIIRLLQDQDVAAVGDHVLPVHRPPVGLRGLDIDRMVGAWGHHEGRSSFACCNVPDGLGLPSGQVMGARLLVLGSSA